MLNKTGFLLLTGLLLFILSSALPAQAPDTLWTKHYGFDGNDEAWQLKSTPDGGFIIVGVSEQNGDIYLLKTDENGDTLWSSLFDFTIDDVGRSVEPLDDGGYVITGYSGGYIVLTRTDSLGNDLWYQYLGSGYGRAVKSTSDGGYIVAAYSPLSGGPEDIFIAKTDSEGELIWSKTYGGSEAERPWDIKETSDGDFIILGWTESYGLGQTDFYVIKTDSNGDSLWTRTYGSGGIDEARSFILKDDNGFIIVGKTFVPVTWADMYVVNADSSGDVIWTKVFPESYYQVTNSIFPTSDGGYVLAAITSNNLAISKVMKIDANGDSLWCRIIEDPAQNLYLRSIVQASDGGYVAAGYHQVPNHANDVFLVKLAPDITEIEDEIAILPDRITLHQNYPNPFNAKTTISFELAEPADIVLSLYDLLGRKVSVIMNGPYDAGSHDITFDASELTSGIYFYKFQSGEISVTKSMILLK
jgi:hypothetical protein